MISGKEAKLAWANGESVQFQHDDYPNGWIDLRDDDEGFSISYFNEAEFRIKPRTITINGVEVPAPFEPEDGDEYYSIDPNYSCGYVLHMAVDEDWIQLGAWRTEEEIKQLVAALRSIFK